MNFNSQVPPQRRRSLTASLLFFGALLVPSMAVAQSAAIVGSLGNFDAANYEGQDVHGMEIQIEGITPADLTPSWCGNKYNCPVVEPYATGVFVRYKSPYDAANRVFTATTVPHTPGAAFAGTCYMFAANYSTAGCDHFGVHLAFTAAAGRAQTTYRWMLEDPNNPGTLIGSATPLFVPTPVYSFIPPAVATNPPVLVAEINLPDPPPPPPAQPPQFGTATWMKVYKTELNREVVLEELTSDNPLVPQTAAQVETEWVLMQPAPPPDGRHRQRNRQVNSGGVSAGARAVIRRYESYAYTGAYDAITHEVACGGDGTCTSPQPGELGGLLVAQMTAANVAVPSLTVAVAGNGTVSSSDKVISCGNKCVGNYSLGTVVTLTAKAGSNTSFTNWTGACSGTALTCSVTVADAVNVGAVFTANAPAGGGGGGGTTQFTLSVGRSNTGTVTSDVTGISCGNSCSAKYNAGTVVTLTATPATGKTFVSWGGVCSGTASSCAVTINSNVSVQANFSK